MQNISRTAKGELIDFELLAIKAQLASVPIPKPVEERRAAIEEREGIKPIESQAVNELIAAADAWRDGPKRK